MSQAGISGIGVISALGRNAEATCRALFGSDPVLPRQPQRFQTALSLPVFEIPVPDSPENLSSLPLRFLLTALREALADARLTPELLRGRRVGIAVGTTVACQLDNIPCHVRLRQGDLSDLSPVPPFVTGIPAEYLRNFLGVKGPAITVSNACASGADAAMIGLDWLRSGQCDLAIAAGCDSVSKVAFNGFNALRVCSPTPCRPFDADRAGLNLGDAAGVVILEAPERAAERGLRVEYELAGAGKTADAFHITQPESSGAELERAIRLALHDADLTPQEVDFVNAHGTGTLVNDRVESAVLARVFGPEVKFQSTKALTGHTLGAAGTIELIFTELMLREKRAAASFRYEKASEEIPVAPLKAPTEISGHAAVSTSLAFGGSNTALAVRQVRADHSTPPACSIFATAFHQLRTGEPDRDALVQLCRRYGLRRPDRLTQLALCAADAVAEPLAGGADCALITVTTYGPATTTCRVLDDILDFPEDQILPTGFSHSVVNAASSYIGTALKIHGPTFAIVGFEDPFHEAVDLVRALFSCGQCRRALIVAVDEVGMTSKAIESLRLTSRPQQPEGACALVLSADPAENRLGKIELADDADGSERLFPCGVPAGLPGELAAADPGRTVRIARLPASQWKQV